MQLGGAVPLGMGAGAGLAAAGALLDCAATANQPTMRQLRSLPLALFAALLPGLAAAQATVPTPPLGDPTPASLYGALLNQWYVGINHVSAGTFIDGATTLNGGIAALPTPAELARSADTAQTQGSKQASAAASVTSTSLGAYSLARDPMDSASTWTGALAYSIVSYWAVLDSPAPVRFDLKLSGTLATSGDRSLDADASGAAVAALAYGSQANPTNESQAALFGAAGFSWLAEGDVLLHELSTLKSSTQTHLDTFGAQSDTAHRAIDVDTELHVTASGTEIKCNGTEPAAVQPLCGRYSYFMNVMLFTGAQNGGLADFSHTLGVVSLSVGGGAAQPLNAISPVPEPATAPMLALGVAGLLAAAARRRLRS